MLSEDILKAHYKEYASQHDSWVNNMRNVKKSIVQTVFGKVSFCPGGEPLRVAVLGASDKRYIRIHKGVFTEVTGKAVEVTTFDIDTSHLSGEEGVVHHDVTRPFPKKFDLVFSHELMKFLEPEKQAEVIKNSHYSLSPGGFSMHIIHSPSIEGTEELRDWQHRVDPDSIIDNLKGQGIPCRKIVFTIESDVGWLRETTVIVTEKPTS